MSAMQDGNVMLTTAQLVLAPPELKDVTRGSYHITAVPRKGEKLARNSALGGGV